MEENLQMSSKLKKHVGSEEKVVKVVPFSKACAIPSAIISTLLFALFLFTVYIFIIYSWGYYGSPFDVGLDQLSLIIEDGEFNVLMLFPFITAFALILTLLYSSLKRMIRGLTRTAVITKDRLLIYDSYLIGEYVFDFSISKIKEVFGNKSFFGKIFGYGEIFVGTGNETVGLDGYKNYEEILLLLKQIIKEKENEEK